LKLHSKTRNSKLRTTKLRVAQLALIAALAMLFLGADTDARFTKLGHQMMCMCGCNQILLECNHVGCTYSDRMRNELTAGLERGDSDSLVLQSFVQKYGNTVLAAPTASGFNIVAWITPFAVFFAATGLAVWFVRAWKARTLAQPVADPNLAPEELDALRKKARQETEF
jgi:cytochrome c-type biogenesis protein CcmH/NrfF